MEVTKKKSNKNYLKTLGMLVGIAFLLWIFNIITNNVFVTPRNLTMLLKQSSVLMILASSLMMLLISKNIDLSGGAGVYLCCCVVALLIVNAGWSMYAAIPVCIIMGMCMGALNGFFIGFVGLPAFIVTLAFQQMFRGIGYVITNAATIGPMPKAFNQISEAYIPPMISVIIVCSLFVVLVFTNIYNYKKLGAWYGGIEKLIVNLAIPAVVCAALIWVFNGFRGIPMAVVVAFVVAVVMYIVSSKTVYGRHIYLIGGNMEAARLAGVRTDVCVFKSYVIEGLMYAIAGIVLTARLGGAANTAGTNLELDAVAAACIGGTSMSGGVGSILGLSVGAVLLTMIDNVMSLMNVSSFLQMVVKGLILLAAVCLDLMMNKAKFRFKLMNKKK